MSKSETLYSAARELIPGGVNSPVRAFSGVGGTPLFIERADGARLYDVDGKAYIDYVGSWGPMVLGHNHRAIRNAVIEAAERGLSFGAPTEMEVKMAELVTELVPTMPTYARSWRCLCSAILCHAAFRVRHRIMSSGVLI